MNLFDELIFKNKNITVCGANENSEFVLNLKKHFEKSDNIVFAPDTMENKFFAVHSKEEISHYKGKGFVIGIVNIEVFEKPICDVVKNYNDLCDIVNVESCELVYPFAVAKTIIEREKYDLLYIDGVNTVSKRFLAREFAKLIRNGMGIRIINTDSNYTEILCRGDGE